MKGRWDAKRNTFWLTRARRRMEKLDARTVVKIAVGLIAPLLIFATHGEVNRKEIAVVLAHAASERTTINTSSRRLRKARKAASLRYHIRTKLRGKGWRIERKGNEILQRLSQKVIKAGKRYEFAIDYVSHEYYGKVSRRKRSILRGKARNGTTHFVVHATLYAMVSGKRVTLAVRRIFKGRTKLSVIRFFIDTIRTSGYRIQRIYVDRWFYSAALIRYLRIRKIPAIVAVPIKGKKGGIRGLLGGRKTRLTSYTVRGGLNGEKIEETHPLALVCRYKKGGRKRHGVVYHAYAILGGIISPRLIEEKYRRRFGIETSYRIVNQSRAWTTSQSVEWRTLYFFIAVILQNIWVNLKWAYFRERKQGVSESHETLTFGDFLDLLEEGIKWLLGRVTHVPLRNWIPGGLLS